MIERPGHVKLMKRAEGEISTTLDEAQFTYQNCGRIYAHLKLDCLAAGNAATNLNSALDLWTLSGRCMHDMLNGICSKAKNFTLVKNTKEVIISHNETRLD